MKQNIFDDIVIVKNNLSLQLEDLDLETTGVSVELYFHTLDIFQAILGLETFYTLGNGLDFDKFNHPRALVHSLLASGWIGEYRLFPPHEMEFLTQVNLHYGESIDVDPKGRASRFLEELGLTVTKQFQEICFEDLSMNYSYDFIEKQAETLFKALQFVIPWHKRLQRLISQNILVITPPTLNLDRLVQTEYFSRLKQSFEKRRPSAHLNNLSDSVAISILIEMVHAYRTGSSRSLPRFLVPSSLFLDVINDAGVGTLLFYQTPSGTVSTVLRDYDYYVYKASLRQRRLYILNEDELARKTVEKYMRVLNAKVTEITKSQKVITQELLEKIDFYGVPLSQAIKDLQLQSLLENAWVKYQAKEEIDQAVCVVIEMCQSGSSKQSAEIAIEGLKEKIGDGAYEFQIGFAGLPPTKKRILKEVIQEVECAVSPINAKLMLEANISSGTETNETRPRLSLNLPYSKPNFIVVWFGGALLELCGWFSYTVSYFLLLIVAEILYRNFATVANGFLLLVGLLFLLFVASTLVVFGSQLRRIARRHRVDPHRNLMKDSRPPILYLRPFNDDYTDNLSPFRRETGEKLLIDALKDVGPGIALARHGPVLSLLGANRIRVNDSDWQETIKYLMSIAPLVVIQADISESLIWEMTTARQCLDPERVLISFIRSTDDSSVNHESLYSRFRKRASGIFGPSLPEEIDHAKFLVFGSDWSARVVKPTRIQSALFTWAPKTALRVMLRPILRGHRIRIAKHAIPNVVFVSVILVITSYFVLNRNSVSVVPIFVDYLLKPSAILAVIACYYFFIKNKWGVFSPKKDEWGNMPP